MYLLKNIIEAFIPEMAYPSSFLMDDFKKLGSFAARKRYCDERLPRIGGGSGRIVYIIDDDKVLKLAKNPKGVAQNNVEGDWSLSSSYDFLAKVIDKHPDDLWLEMERAKKIGPNRFKQLAGFSLNDLERALYCWNKRKEGITNDPAGLDSYRLLQENPLFQAITDMAINYDMKTGDFARVNSWGEIKGRLVMVDYGLNSDNYQEFYAPKHWK